MHALRMYSDIIYLQSPTNKFMQAMSLIEYLANPFEYENMKKVKKKIITFSADSKQSYLNLCEKLKILTSAIDNNDQQIGLRTCIVHNGKTIEQSIEKSYQVDLLLRELQSYICNFINFVIDYSDAKWDEIDNKVDEQYNKVQSIVRGYTGKNEADTTVIIDVDFLNMAVQEVFKLYPQYSDRTIDLCMFMQLLLKQSDIERLDYQIPINFLYSVDIELYKFSPILKISELDGLGFDSLGGEFSFFTGATNNNHHLILEQCLKNSLTQVNCCIDKISMYNNIIFISDRNNIPDEIFKNAENSCKNIILGRLDNKRTTSYSACTWFDIEYVIMACIGIKIYEECKGDFIFYAKDGKYPDD